MDICIIKLNRDEFSDLLFALNIAVDNAYRTKEKRSEQDFRKVLSKVSGSVKIIPEGVLKENGIKTMSEVS